MLLDPLARLPIRADAQQQVIPWRLALLNMLGTCACMTQDFERGLGFFRSAMELFQRDSKNLGKLVNSHGVSQEAWLEQNIALAFEFMGKFDKAETHWNRYFDHLEYNLSAFAAGRLSGQSGLRRAQPPGRPVHDQGTLELGPRLFCAGPTSFGRPIPTCWNDCSTCTISCAGRKRPARSCSGCARCGPTTPRSNCSNSTPREVRDVNDLTLTMADLKRIDQKFPGNPQVANASPPRSTI